MSYKFRFNLPKALFSEEKLIPESTKQRRIQENDQQIVSNYYNIQYEDIVNIGECLRNMSVLKIKRVIELLGLTNS